MATSVEGVDGNTYVPCDEFGEGWLVSRKPRKGNPGRVDLTWIAPDGNRFNSRLRVRQYLRGAATSRRSPAPRAASAATHSAAAGCAAAPAAASAASAAADSVAASAAGAVAASADTEVGCDGDFVVERLLGVRRRGGRKQYRVHWAGFGDEDDTWEPSENLHPDLVEEFESGLCASTAANAATANASLASAAASSAKRVAAPAAASVAATSAAPAAAASSSSAMAASRVLAAAASKAFCEEVYCADDGLWHPTSGIIVPLTPLPLTSTRSPMLATASRAGAGAAWRRSSSSHSERAIHREWLPYCGR